MPLADLHTGTGSGNKTIISPTAIETFYNDHQDDFKVEDQVKLRMIQIPDPAGSPPGSAKQMAGEILQKIDSGVPFADMAKSIPPASTGHRRRLRMGGPQEHTSKN